MPVFLLRVPTVDVVSACVLPASSQIRSFPSETRVRPVLPMRLGFGDSHCIDKKPSSSHTPVGTTSADHPVIDLRGPTYVRLAGRKRAETEEGVRGKAAVVTDDVGVEPQVATSLARMPLDRPPITRRGVWGLVSVKTTFNGIDYPISVPTDDRVVVII